MLFRSIALVGGAHNGERKDLVLLYDAGGHMLRGDYAPVWERKGGKNEGMALGSLGAFLVLESPEHAKARGAKPLGKLSAVLSDRSSRPEGAIKSALGKMWQKISGKLTPGKHAVISGSTGSAKATAEEREFLKGLGVPVRATGTYIGHGFEPQFAMNIALATLALKNQALFPPADASGLEQPMSGAPAQIVVTGVGHWRGEGLALVEAAG